MFLESFLLLGEKQLMWLNDLKVALVLQDTKKMEQLLDNIPTLDNLEDIKQAKLLIDQMLEVVTQKKEQTTLSMQKIRKNLDFLNATASHKKHKLDIFS